MKTFHILFAMKPFKGNNLSNIFLELPTGINIGDCRVVFASSEKPWSYPNGAGGVYSKDYQSGDTCKDWNNFSTLEDNLPIIANSSGRFPANIILEESEDISELFPYSKGMSGGRKNNDNKKTGHESIPNYNRGIDNINVIRNDEGSASRFFKRVKKD